jgi:hypothetical protein
MLRCLALLTFLVVTAPIAAEPRHIVGEKDGIRFDYTSKLERDGQLILNGTYLNTGEQFSLTVSRRGFVDGWVGTAPVHFEVSPEVRDQAAAELSSSNNVEFAQSSKSR